MEECTYAQQHDACEEVLAWWAHGRRWVVLCAQMQCGKTGVMRHIGFLLNRSPIASGLRHLLGIPTCARDSVTILQHLSDRQLLEQTKRDLCGAVREDDIFHSPSLNGKGGFEAKLARPNQAVLLDESHWGAGRNGRVDKAMDAAGLSMAVGLHGNAEMARKNTYVLSVSATPFAEVLTESGKKVVFMQPGSGYNSIASMLAEGRLVSNTNDLFSFFMAPKKSRKPPTVESLEQFRLDCMETPRLHKHRAHATERGPRDGVFVVLRCGPTSEWKDTVIAWCEKNRILAIEWDCDGHEEILEEFDDMCGGKVPPKDWQAYLKRREETGDEPKFK
mmetsp:Transcript_17222/g.31263  ORF Transcript_17222/g.31263 Transcript_17222/m.31263 type:complete len:333 (-) Transcript_17222:420-1418(-)